jgi:hypothetical protein
MNSDFRWLLIRFDSYILLKPGYGAEHNLDRLDIQVIDQVLRVEGARNLLGFEYSF